MANNYKVAYPTSKKSFKRINDARRHAMDEIGVHSKIQYAQTGMPVYANGLKYGVVAKIGRIGAEGYYWVSRGKIYRLMNQGDITEGHSPVSPFDYALMRIYEQY